MSLCNIDKGVGYVFLRRLHSTTSLHKAILSKTVKFFFYGDYAFLLQSLQDLPQLRQKHEHEQPTVLHVVRAPVNVLGNESD